MASGCHARAMDRRKECHDRDLMRLPIPLSEVKGYADCLLEQKVQPWEEFKPAGSRRARRFMHRHGVKKVKQKPIELARKRGTRSLYNMAMVQEV